MFFTGGIAPKLPPPQTWAQLGPEPKVENGKYPEGET